MTILRDIRLCFMGDSFINGTGDPELLGWTGRLARELAHKGHRVTYYNLGIRRETSEGLYQRFLPELDARFGNDQPALVILSFGTNDTMLEKGRPRVAMPQTLVNLRKMIVQLPPQHRLLIIGPPVVADAAHNHRSSQLATEMARVCQELQVPFLNVCASLAQKWAWTHEVKRIDGAHPQVTGYEALADLVSQWPVWQEWVVKGKIP